MVGERRSGVAGSAPSRADPPTVPDAPGVGVGDDVVLSDAGHHGATGADALRAAVLAPDPAVLAPAPERPGRPDVVPATANATDEPRDWPG